MTSCEDNSYNFLNFVCIDYRLGVGIRAGTGSWKADIKGADLFHLESVDGARKEEIQ